VTVLVLLESPNLGKGTGNEASPKTFGPVVAQDVLAEVKLHDAFQLTGGLMLVPFSRNVLQSTTTYLGLDFGNTTAIFDRRHADLGRPRRRLPDQGPGARRQARVPHRRLPGGAQPDHLHAGDAAGGGIAETPSASPATPSTTSRAGEGLRLQRHLFRQEEGAGVGTGVDFQKGDGKEPYFAVSASAFAAIPLNGDRKSGGDEIAGLLQYIHYDGQDTFAAIPAQNDLLAEAAYYNKGLRFSVFAKFETRQMVDDAAQPQNAIWYGGGFKYYVARPTATSLLAYQRTQFPDAPTSGPGARNSTNQITGQLQLFNF
jgi:hypothetical protein